jgi:hypothetical protein
MNLINLIIFSVFAAILSLLTVVTIRQYVQKKRLAANLIQSFIDNKIVADKLAKVFNEKEALKLEQSEGFVKFLSESRESAFEYIETTQAVIKEYNNTIEQILEWNNTYGTTLGDTPHSEAIKQIELAHGKLRDLLPRNNEIPNN